MKKPLTFCLLATTTILALAAGEKNGIFAVAPNVYDGLQLLLASMSAGVAAFHIVRRLRRESTSVTALVIGVVAGTLAGIVATKNPTMGTQLGSVFAHTAIAALFANSLLVLLTYGELEGAVEVPR